MKARSKHQVVRTLIALLLASAPLGAQWKNLPMDGVPMTAEARRIHAPRATS